MADNFRYKVLFATRYNVSNLFTTYSSAYGDTKKGCSLLVNMNADDLFFNSQRWHQVYGTKYVNNLSGKFLGRSRLKQAYLLKKIISDHDVDVVFTTGLVAPIFRVLRVPYVYFVYGGDADHLAFWGSNVSEFMFPKIWDLMRKTLHSSIIKKIEEIERSIVVSITRYGMRGAICTVFPPHQNELMKKIGYKNKGFLPHTLDSIFFSLDKDDKVSAQEKIRKELQCERIFISTTRHLWKERKMARFLKGNDVLIRAYKMYLDKTNDKKSTLILVEKGNDLEHSKKLTVELGVSNYITWIEHQPRKSLVEYYLAADACFDQFQTPILAYCAIEPLACWTPTASYIGDNSPYHEKTPIFNTKDYLDLSDFMVNVVDDGYQKKHGMIARDWVYKNCSNSNFSYCLEEIIRSTL